MVVVLTVVLVFVGASAAAAVFKYRAACSSGRLQCCFREVSGSNLGRGIGRRDGGFLLYPSVPLRKPRQYPC